MAETDEFVGLLKKCPVKDCSNVLHRLVDGLCQRARPTYEDYSSIWTLQEWWAVSERVTDTFKAAVRESWTKDQLLNTLSGLDDEYRSAMVDVLNSRRSELRQQLLTDSHAISQATLSDFDWKLKLVMSSDKMSSVQDPVVSLDLDINSCSGHKTVSVELDRDELHNLIASLEAANKAIIQLKS